MCRFAIAIASLFAVAANLYADVVIPTVPIGNPGNAADTRYGSFGSVTQPYRIGTFEVTAGQYTEFLNAVAQTDTYGLYSTAMGEELYGCGIQRTGEPGNYSYGVGTGWTNHPVNYVSWGDAARFANWLHNGQPTGAQGLSTTEDGSYYLDGATSESAVMDVTRKTTATWVIPTEDEWYKAAYHKNDGVTGNYWDYPTRTDSTPDNGPGDTGNSANFYDGDYTVGYPYYTTPVGAFGASESPYGTFDQGGNVREWNETTINGVRGWRGGSWYFDAEEMRASDRYQSGPSAQYSSIGFRVGTTPEPGSIALVVSGGLALLFWQWRRRGT